MAQLMERVLEFFEAEDWRYELDLEEGLLESGVLMDNGNFLFRIYVDEEARTLAFVMSVAATIPEDRRATVCEFLVRTNWNQGPGCFHMDMQDGEVHYRSILDVENGELSVTMVRNIVMAGCESVDRTYPGLMAVSYAGLSPAEATGETLYGEPPATAMVQ